MKRLFYNCNISNNWILFEVSDNVADMKLIQVDHQNFRLFCKLIREAIDDLIDKKIKMINQLVTRDDYEQILKNKTSWKIVEKTTDSNYESVLDPNALLIECKIEDFIDNFAKAHGIKSLE